MAWNESTELASSGLAGEVRPDGTLFAAPAARIGGTAMPVWIEFKNAILPWLIAAGVVALLITEHHRTTEALINANGRLATAVEVQGRALEGVRELLAAQGYTLPPLDASQ